MQLSESRRDDGAIEISIEGELDLSNAATLRDAMFRAFDANEDAGIWLDFGGCTFIDSTGLRVIIEGARRAGESSRRLGIRNLTEQPLRLFELTSVDPLRAARDRLSQTGRSSEATTVWMKSPTRSGL